MSDYHSPTGIRDKVAPGTVFAPQNRAKPAAEDAATTPNDLDARAAPQRVLVVEDEYLLSSLLAEDLRAAGYEIVGPCSSLATALRAAGKENFDAAVLDINLRGELVYPAAEKLAERQIPFVFLSGYATANMPERFRDYPRIAKPAPPATVLRMIKMILRKQG
jgi:DNA-binding response OmpR family regulator